MRKYKYHHNKKLILVNKNDKKLKEMLLTKHKLHKKIGNMMARRN